MRGLSLPFPGLVFVILKNDQDSPHTGMAAQGIGVREGPLSWSVPDGCSRWPEYSLLWRQLHHRAAGGAGPVDAGAIDSDSTTPASRLILA